MVRVRASYQVVVAEEHPFPGRSFSSPEDQAVQQEHHKGQSSTHHQHQRGQHTVHETCSMKEYTISI